MKHHFPVTNLVIIVLLTRSLKLANSAEFNHSLLLEEIREKISKFARSLASDEGMTCDELVINIFNKSSNNYELCDTNMSSQVVPVLYRSNAAIADTHRRCACIVSLLHLITPVQMQDNFFTTFCNSESDFACDRSCDSFNISSSMESLKCIVRSRDVQSSSTAFMTASNISIMGVITGLSCDILRQYGHDACGSILTASAEDTSNSALIAGLVTGLVILTLIFIIIITGILWWYRRKCKIKMKNMQQVEATNKVDSSAPQHNLDNALYAFAETISPSDYSKSTLMNYFQTHYQLTLTPRSDFEFVGELGRGAFGIVYKGITTSHDDSQKIEIAIKTMKDNSTIEEAREFMSEAIVMTEFKHPNVMSLLGLCIEARDDNAIQPMILLPYMANGDLKSFLLSSRKSNSVETLPEHLSLNILESLCLNIANGMKYLAERKYVHRDLAARNCMVDEHLNVKVADFGFTRDIYGVEYYRLSRKAKLPVKWMAPESLLDNVYNEKTDVWSFGITCWEVYGLGRAPYPGIDNSEITEYIRSGNRLKKPFLCSSSMYSQVIFKCWNEDPRLRPSFKELAFELTSTSSSEHNQVKPSHEYFVLDQCSDDHQPMYTNLNPPHNNK